MEIILRTYLLAGLVGHKALWEILKRRQGGGGARRVLPLKVRLIKGVKAAILLGIVAQTVIPSAWYGPLLITDDPRVVQLAGVVLYTIGLLCAVLGRVQLGDNWADIETAEVLREQQVVARGVYRLIRHPIYVGDLLLLIGLELALNCWLVAGAVALVPIVLKQAVREEAMLMQSLRGYGDYCRATKRFIPYLV